MSGLEKILQEIHSDAERESRELLEKAEAEKKEILAGAEEDAAAVKAAAQEKARALAGNLRERSLSAAALRVRQMRLREKQALVQETLTLAQKQLVDKPAAEYFELLLRLLKDAVLPENGVLYLSERDIARLPEDFRKRVTELAEKKGGSLAISSVPRQIDGGFILEYGGIEENCSFRAMFTAEREALEDIAARVLFAE